MVITKQLQLLQRGVTYPNTYGALNRTNQELLTHNRTNHANHIKWIASDNAIQIEDSSMPAFFVYPYQLYEINLSLCVLKVYISTGFQLDIGQYRIYLSFFSFCQLKIKYKQDSRGHVIEYMLNTKHTNAYSGSINFYFNMTSATSGQVAAYHSSAL